MCERVGLLLCTVPLMRYVTADEALLDGRSIEEIRDPLLSDPKAHIADCSV